MVSEKVNRISADVLVVGGGVAAAMTAIVAAKYGVNVALVDKGILGRSGSTPTSAGAFSAVLSPELGGDPQDSDAIHFEDLVGDRGGEYLNDQRLTKIYIREATNAFFASEKLGVGYRKTSNDKYYMFRSLGRSYPRVCIPLGSGYGMMDALRKVVLHRRVQVLENVMITRLFTHQRRVVGAYGIHRFTGEIWIIQSKTIVLACGSATGLSQFRSANFPTTGDGFCLAFEVGARLFNMEFIEFTLIPVPGGVPIAVGGISPLPGLGAKFYNSLDEHFMERYDQERQDRTARATLVRSVQQEIIDGRGPILMDATMISREAMESVPQVRNLVARLDAMGIDCTKERFPWVPAIHTHLGGIRVDEYGRTGVTGLFACGEVTGFAGIFGADRIGTAIAACQVFGSRTGEAAVHEAIEMPEPLISKYQVREEASRLRAIRSSTGETPRALLEKVWKVTNDGLFVIRNGRGLKKAVQAFSDIRKQVRDEGARLDNNRDLLRALEVENLALTGELVATAALLREESRGQHYREDFPQRNDQQWLKWIIIEKDRRSGVRVNFWELPLATYPLKPSFSEGKVRDHASQD